MNWILFLYLSAYLTEFPLFMLRFTNIAISDSRREDLYRKLFYWTSAIMFFWSIGLLMFPPKGISIKTEWLEMAAVSYVAGVIFLNRMVRCFKYNKNDGPGCTDALMSIIALGPRMLLIVLFLVLLLCEITSYYDRVILIVIN